MCLGRSEAGSGQIEVQCSVSPSNAGLAHGRSECWDMDEEKLTMAASVALVFPLMS
jgi:hypothetical protein